MTPAQQIVCAQYVAQRRQGATRIHAATVVANYFDTQERLTRTSAARTLARVAAQHKANVVVTEMPRQFGSVAS